MAALQRHLAVACHAQASCRAQQQASQPAAAPRPHAMIDRRSALAMGVAAAVAAAAPRPASAAVDVAAEATAAAAAVAEGAAPAAALDVVSWPQWVDRTFAFSYPPGFQEIDPAVAAPPPPGPGADRVAENPLKAAVRSPDGQQRIDVVVRQATALKRTLFQVTDITLLGDAREVARLLLPPGAAVLGSAAVSVPQPPKDTGTVLGTIQRDPVTYYSYEVLLPDQTHLQLAAAAQLGRVYVAAASAPDGVWAERGAALQEAVLSFRLRYKS